MEALEAKPEVRRRHLKEARQGTELRRLDLVEVVDGAKFREKLVEKRKSFEAEGDGNSRE